MIQTTSLASPPSFGGTNGKPLDFVHEIDARIGIGPKQPRRLVYCLDIHAVLADALALRNVNMRDDPRALVETDKPKAATLPALANLLGVEAPKPVRLDSFGDAPDHCGLADPRCSRNQQHM
jgi:hypothetical protein